MPTLPNPFDEFGKCEDEPLRDEDEHRWENTGMAEDFMRRMTPELDDMVADLSRPPLPPEDDIIRILETLARGSNS